MTVNASLPGRPDQLRLANVDIVENGFSRMHPQLHFQSEVVQSIGYH
jgi:hypothetical protein